MEKATDPEVSSTDAGNPAQADWLTVETLLYGMIVILAVGLRLWDLDKYPLSGTEAEQGLAAWALYRGGQLEPGLLSPLLLTFNTLTFLLFGASEASARLATVLLGTILVTLPAAFRRRLGPTVCLFASFLLAISPSAIFLSRTVNSEIGVAAGALMLVAGFFNWAENGHHRWLWLAAGGLAIVLTAGPMAYSILLVFALIVLVKYSAFKTLVSDRLQLRNAGHDQPDEEESSDHPAQAASDKKSQPDSPRANNHETDQKGMTQPGLRNVGIFLLITVVLLATTFTYNLSGLGSMTGFLTDWLSRFSFQARPQAGFNAVFQLTIYEPLLVFAGLTGLAMVLLRNNLVSTAFAGWFIGLLLIDLVMGGRPNGHIILLVTPLAFLAATALAELWAGVHRWGSWNNEGILLATGLVIAAFGYIGLTGWLTRSCGPDDRLCQYSWLQPIAALALFLVIVIFFAYINDAGSALRGAALAAVTVGLLVTINIGWRLNYGPLMHLGFQPLAGIPASTELIQLTSTLVDQSESRVGDARLLDITMAGLESPALRWQLREFRHLNQANTPQGGAATTAIITPVNYTAGLDLSQAYLGQDLGLDAVWSPVGLPVKEFINWLVYRQVDERPQSNRAVLWLRLDGN